MKIIRTIFLFGVFALIVYVKYASAPRNGPHVSAPVASSSSTASPVADSSVPQKALNVLNVVRSTGLPPEGYVGGRVFQNREGHLPPGGDYREFDVDPHNGGRNAERIIVEWNTKKAWYTGDHYQTFIPLP